MTGSPTFEGLTEDQLEQHRQIHFYLDQLAVTLEAIAREPEVDDWLRRLGAQLSGLVERLREHQSAEEGGLFDAILEVLPACRVEIDRLTNQHGKMIEILEMARLHVRNAVAGEADTLRTDVERYLETIRSHESEEEALLARAIARETRAAD